MALISGVLVFQAPIQYTKWHRLVPFTIENMKKEIKGMPGGVWFITPKPSPDPNKIADSCTWYTAASAAMYDLTGFGVCITDTQAQHLIDTGDDIRIYMEYGHIAFWVRKSNDNPNSSVFQVFMVEDEEAAAIFKLRWL